jgi:GntR family transcriptional regulator/MocR family aminotransferase
LTKASGYEHSLRPIGGIAAGLHVVVDVPGEIEEPSMLAEARKREKGLYGLGEHRFRSRRGPALLLGHAVAREPAIRAAVRALAEAVEAAKG